MMLLSAYVLLLAFALIRRNGGQVITAGLLLGNYGMNTAFVYGTGEGLPWPWFLTTDYMTGLLLYIGCETKWQRALIGTYGAELIAHAAFGYSNQNVWACWNYYWALDYVAWAQIALVGTWIAYDMVGHRRGTGSRVSPVLDCDEASS